MKSNLSFFHYFFEIFIHPRKVIKLILENEPGYFVGPLVITYSFLGSFNTFLTIPMFDHLPFPLAPLAGAFIFSLFGVLSFLIYSRVVFGLGKWLGGNGTYLEVKTACAWAYPPLFVGLLFDYLKNLSNLTMVFHGNFDFKDFLTTPKTSWYYVLTAISFIFDFWGASLSVVNVAQALKISIKKSIAVSAIIWGVGWLLAFIVVTYFYLQLR